METNDEKANHLCITTLSTRPSALLFKERIIDPAVQEVVKAVTAKYTAEELITKRPAVSAAMNTGSVNALAKHGIEKVRRSAKDSYFRI